MTTAVMRCASQLPSAVVRADDDPVHHTRHAKTSGEHEARHEHEALVMRAALRISIALVEIEQQEADAGAEVMARRPR